MSQVMSSPHTGGRVGLAKPARLVVVMAAAIAVDLAFQRLTGDVTPGLLLLPAVIGLAWAGGPTAGLLAAAAAIAFAAVDLSAVGPLWQPPYHRLLRLVVLCVSAPTVALVIGMLQRRLQELTAERLRAEREHAAADRRAFVTERDTLVQERETLARTGEAYQRRLADTIAALPGVVWEATVGGSAGLRVDFISRYVEHLLGYDVREWTEGPDLWLAVIHPDDRDRVRRRLADIGGGGVGTDADHPLEFRWVARGGAELWVETRVARVVGADGQRCVGLRGVTLDITARRRLEDALRDRAAELTATARRLRESNDELDQFAYVTSHDLKAPLRGIANLSTWIEEDLGERVTPQAHGQMDLLRGRVQRMEKLIDGLLQFSRVGRTQSQVELTDVAGMMADVVDWVGPPPGIRVEVGPDMPTFNADRLRLGQVLANLVGNAVKHHGTAQGVVRVTCRPMPDAYEFAIVDDGPGIEPRYHERIFGVFQTLQRRDKVEGTGIGLALVRKIVTAKGGTVSVESTPGHGATFRFTWPRVDPGQQPWPAAVPRRATP